MQLNFSRKKEPKLNAKLKTMTNFFCVSLMLSQQISSLLILFQQNTFKTWRNGVSFEFHSIKMAQVLEIEERSFVNAIEINLKMQYNQDSSLMTVCRRRKQKHLSVHIRLQFVLCGMCVHGFFYFFCGNTFLLRSTQKPTVPILFFSFLIRRWNIYLVWMTMKATTTSTATLCNQLHIYFLCNFP